MKLIALMLIDLCTIICSEFKASSDNIVCQKWLENHLYLTQDVHYYNVTFAFVKIDTLSDLNITIKCPPQEYNIEMLKIYANNNIFINNDLDLRGILNILNRTHGTDVVIQNVNGFNEKKGRTTYFRENDLRSIQTQKVYHFLILVHCYL